MRISDYPTVTVVTGDSKMIIEVPDLGTKTIDINRLIDNLGHGRSAADMMAGIKMKDLQKHYSGSCDPDEVKFPLYATGKSEYDPQPAGYYSFRLVDMPYAWAFNGFGSTKNLNLMVDTLGNSVTERQLAGIKDGTFRGLALGSFWIINDIVWRIVDFDYYYGRGTTRHHVIVMPDNSIIETNFDDSDRIYKDSHVKRALSVNEDGQIGSVLAIIFGAFGRDNVLNFNNIFASAYASNGIPSASSFMYTYADLPTASQLFIDAELGSGIYDYKDNRPFSLMLYTPYYVVRNQYWLRTTTTAKNAAYCVNNNNCLDWAAKSAVRGVRPYFILAPPE